MTIRTTDEEAMLDEQALRIEFWVALHSIPNFISRDDPDGTDWKIVRKLIGHCNTFAFILWAKDTEPEYGDPKYLKFANSYLDDINKIINDNPHN